MNKLLYIFFLFPFMIYAQNNLGFETWSNNEPVEWYTSNIALTLTNVTQSNDAHSGSSAAKGEVVNFLDLPFPAWLTTGALGQPYIPVSQKYTQVKGYFKFNQQSSNEQLLIAVYVFDSGINIVGAGAAIIEQAATSYTQFMADILYISENTPAFMQIQITIGASENTYLVGTSFLIDDITLETVSGIEKQLGITPKEFSLSQNFPNPFNPSTTFKFSVPKASDVSLKVYNITGQEVANVVNEKLAAGEYSIDWNAENLASGIYIYQIKAGEFIQSRRMALIK